MVAITKRMVAMEKKTANKLDNEQELVQRSLNDVLVFEQIYIHYYPKIYNYIRINVNYNNVAEDITSQVFIKALAGLGSYDPLKGQFSMWLFKIAANTLKDYYRSQKYSATSINVIHQLTSTGKFVIEDKIIAREAKGQLLQALQQLTGREKNIIALKFWAGLSNRKIAQAVGISENNVAVILFRSLRRLKKILADNRVDIPNL